VYALRTVDLLVARSRRGRACVGDLRSVVVGDISDVRVSNGVSDCGVSEARLVTTSCERREHREIGDPHVATIRLLDEVRRIRAFDFGDVDQNVVRISRRFS
jgi:hypothetical protein